MVTVRNSHVLAPTILVAVNPQAVNVDTPGWYVHETRPNHYRHQIGGRGGSLIPKEMSGISYEHIVAVKVPPDIESFNLVFRIFGDNLPHEDLVLIFRAIHYKRPEGS